MAVIWVAITEGMPGEDIWCLIDCTHRCGLARSLRSLSALLHFERTVRVETSGASWGGSSDSSNLLPGLRYQLSAPERFPASFGIACAYKRACVHHECMLNDMLYAVERSFLTPDELGRDYRRVCRVAGLHPTREGYGLIHARNTQGERYTLMTSDVEYVRTLAGAPGAVLEGLKLSAGKFPRYRRGWPDEWLK
ncbi:hypothetical protein HNR07_005839 [Nocardiopsis metallicus]|uniref:Uncharacterized protein n=2 Tax=Nocardiopsis metallicus TaxID=179819 RepID=A0A840WEQ0_9ACTN|nr:hypothetical protein [Nocardiopsis metallicus]